MNIFQDTLSLKKVTITEKHGQGCCHAVYTIQFFIMTYLFTWFNLFKPEGYIRLLLLLYISQRTLDLSTHIDY